MTDLHENGVRELLYAGAASVNPFEVGDGVRMVVVPEGYEIRLNDAEKFAAQPRRKRGSATMGDLLSLVDYTKNHQGTGTAVYVDPNSMRVTSVIDDHLPGESHEDAGHGEHRAVLQLKHTPEWLIWGGHDESMMTQVEFAEFVEDNQKDVRDPEPAVLLEIASTFQSKTDATFKSAVRLQDGSVSIAYHEDVTAKAGIAGDLKIPGTFKIALAVFEGGPKYEVIARLRHRCSGGNLKLGYKLERVTDVLRFALRDDQENGVLAVLDRDLPGAKVYVGAPR